MGFFNFYRVRMTLSDGAMLNPNCIFLKVINNY
jgi:hypothetical protein